MSDEKPSVPARYPLRSQTSLVVVACLGMAGVLMLVSVGGSFTNDEPHYLASILGLKAGTFQMEWTRGLLPSRELLAFGGFNSIREVTKTPVSSVQPPLYAFLALPFSWFGFRGLIAMNTLAFAATGGGVYALARRSATRARTPWLALGAFWFASFSIEYAVGMWPHALAVFLCTAGFALATKRGDALPSSARLACAFALLGLAMGVRYQEAIYAALLAATVVGRAWCSPSSRAESADENAIGFRDRARAALSTVASIFAGVGGPIAASAYVNHLRLGSFNPVNKSPGYLAAPKARSLSAGLDAVADAARALGMRVVDFSWSRSVTPDAGTVVVRPNAFTHAVIYDGVVKKALLQSAPWLAVVFVVLVLAWKRQREPGSPSTLPRAELRTIAVVVFGVLLVFSSFGLKRPEGFCFNMRYFLELMPLAAVALAWACEPLAFSRASIAVGVVVGVLPAAVAVALPVASTPRDLLILRAPLALALLAGVTFVVDRDGSRRARARAFAAFALSACFAWSFAVHCLEDLRGALTIRARHEYYKDVLAAHLSAQRTALVAYWGATVPFAPLQLDYELLIVDPMLDGGATARPLVDQLLALHWRVLVLPQLMPNPIVQSMLAGQSVRQLAEDRLVILEVSPSEDR